MELSKETREQIFNELFRCDTATGYTRINKNGRDIDFSVKREEIIKEIPLSNGVILIYNSYFPNWDWFTKTKLNGVPIISDVTWVPSIEGLYVVSRM